MLIAIVGIALAIVPERSGVTYVYRDALHRWLAGQDLYNADVHGFLYLPASVLLYGPLLLKPALQSYLLSARSSPCPPLGLVKQLSRWPD